MKKTIILETLPGNDFHQVAIKAKMATAENQDVQFDFNGVMCNVTRETDVSFLYRDYTNSWVMGWKTIGEYSHLAEYPKRLKEKLEIKKAEREKRQAEEAKAYKEAEEKQKQVLFSKIENEPFLCSNEEALKKWEESNKDGYGGAIIRYAKEWGRLMQLEMKKGSIVADVAKETSHEADYDGLTGFMYGAAVQVLSDCWQHGEELRKWHNGEYNHTGSGVVNPAILTITV